MSKTRYYETHLRAKHFQPKYWFSWLGIALLALTAQLPLAWQRALGASLGRLFYYANRKRRHVAHTNLALCFPDFPAAARENIMHAHYRLAGQAHLDIGFLAFAAKSRVRKKIRISGLDAYRTLSQQKPIILCVPHLVGMNTAAVLAETQAQISMVKKQKNPLLNWLLSRARRRFGVQLIARAQGLRPAVRALKEGTSFIYLPDEDFGGKDSVFVPFFGVPRATLTTVGRLASLCGATTVYCFPRLLPGGAGYDIEITSPLENFPSNNLITDAQRINALLEAGIRREPAQYLWTFKLFRNPPDQRKSYYD